MTTLTLADFQLSPEIILGKDEHRTLMMLATAGIGQDKVSDGLLHELERAMVVADGFVPPSVVRMGSTVTYRAGEETRTVQLVYPKDADIALGKVSVLTPIGTALIGLRAGQSITWRTRDDRDQALTVVRVVQFTDGDPEPPSAA
jgi:regulator of nucleoside diphosphate kinase